MILLGTINHTIELAVGPPQHIAAGQRRDATLQQPGFVVATGVATKTARGLPTPVVESAKLQNIVNNLYKGTTNPNRVGYGTTMDAIRNEIATGSPTGRRMHITKGQESLQGLTTGLRRTPLRRTMTDLLHKASRTSYERCFPDECFVRGLHRGAHIWPP